MSQGTNGSPSLHARVCVFKYLSVHVSAWAALLFEPDRKCRLIILEFYSKLEIKLMRSLRKLVMVDAIPTLRNTVSFGRTGLFSTTTTTKEYVYSATKLVWIFTSLIFSRREEYLPCSVRLSFHFLILYNILGNTNPASFSWRRSSQRYFHECLRIPAGTAACQAKPLRRYIII